MTLNGDGKFSCEWNNINNCLFREGKKYDTPVNYKSLGDVDIKYGVDYQPDENGYYYNDTFESGAGNWTARGSAKLDIFSRQVHDTI